MRKFLPIAVSFIFGVLMFALWFEDSESRSLLHFTLIDYWQIIFAFGLLVGVVSFLSVASRKISRGEEPFYNGLLIFGAVLMPTLAMIDGLQPNSYFQWMFENVQAPMQSSVFALLAFFVASAAFRGFRARNAQSITLLLVALIVIIGRAPMGELVWGGFDELIQWIRDYPSTSAKRAVLIGIGLGSITTSLRVIFGVERTYLGER